MSPFFKKNKTQQKKVSTSLNPNQKKEVKKLIKAEERANDEIKMNAPTTWNITPNNVASVQALSLIAQGDDFNNRTADVITMKQLECNFNVFNTSATVPDTIRIVILRDIQCDGADPAGTDLFEHATDPLSVYNHVHQLNHPHRFDILYDKLIRLNRVGSGEMSLSWKHKINMKGKKAKYIGTTNGAASLGLGSPFAVVISSNAVAVSEFNLDYSLTYCDD